jgi:phenylpropionate dioxygenase-like ring-hydroxylating dioxygenase large terminal subunit
MVLTPTSDPLGDRVLYNDWHALAKSDDLPPGHLKAATLLDMPIVLWRGADGTAHAWPDRCPHRSVKLSAGNVIDNTLVCSYHGLVYAAAGQCVYVPARPDYVPPPQACVRPYALQEQYGLIFVCLGEPAQAIPAFWEWDDPSYIKVLSGPHECQAGGYRAIENFLDLTHFPFIHRDILGDPSHATVPDYQVETTADGIQMRQIQVWQPDPVGQGAGALVDYNYWVFRPLTAYLQKQTATGERLTIIYYVTPISEESCIGWMWQAANFGTDADQDAMRAFQDTVAQQDATNLATHDPKWLPLDNHLEFHLPTDRGSLAYRQWLRQLGIRYGVR